jgi:putative transposase
VANAKRVYRLYAEEGLAIRSKVPRRKRAWRYGVGRPRAVAPNEVWSMDFVSDALLDDRPIRILAVIDAHTREALSIAPRASFRALDVVAELDRLGRQRGQDQCDGPLKFRLDHSIGAGHCRVRHRAPSPFETISRRPTG